MSKQNNLTAEEWNKKYPVGTRVVFEDILNKYETVTRSEAWELGDGTPVVALHGKTGCYFLKFLTIVEQE